MLKAFWGQKYSVLNMKIARSGEKRVRFWPFWGQKVDQNCLKLVQVVPLGYLEAQTTLF